MSVLDSLPAGFVGERLRLAREEDELTLQEVADKVGISRATLLAIEKGQRQPQFDELMKLSELYRTTLGIMFNPDAVHVDFVPRFRQLPNASDKGAAEAVKMMAHLAKVEVEIENLLGIKRASNYPPERPILSGNVEEQAERDAKEIRQHLGIGGAPIADIVSLLEMELGVRVYVRRVDSRVSGLFAYAEEVGPCILLNANNPCVTCNLVAAQAFGHLVSTRGTLQVIHADEVKSSREERYAVAFAKSFLLPARSLKIRFQEMTAGSGSISRHLAVLFAHSFGVSYETLVRRLEELGLIKEGTWDWFQFEGRVTNQLTKRVLGDLVLNDAVDYAQMTGADHPTTLRLGMLAAEAHRRELLSEGQLVELLRVDRIELRVLMDDIGLVYEDTDDTPLFLE